VSFWFSRLTVYSGFVLVWFCGFFVFSSFGLSWFFFFSDVYVIALERLPVVELQTVLAAYSVSRIWIYKILENHIGQ